MPIHRGLNEYNALIHIENGMCKYWRPTTRDRWYGRCELDGSSRKRTSCRYCSQCAKYEFKFSSRLGAALRLIFANDYRVYSWRGR